MNNYLRIENYDGKIWLLPEEGLRTALCLYQPSSTKGKILKKFLPMVNKLGRLTTPLYKKIGIMRTVYNLEKVVTNYLSILFQHDDTIQYAVFLGTPSVHQKITIQIFSQRHIYGYCKITDNLEIYNIFKHEEQMLRFLHDCGICNVPQCIACGEVGEKRYSFVQTTMKTTKSTVNHELSVKELEFLTQLKNKTSIKKNYKQTDFCRSVNRLKERMSILIDNGYDICFVEKAIARVEDYYGRQLDYCVCHRDFTPWNMFYNGTEVFVFDFEYACFEYPPYLDAVHYFMQTAIFEKKLNIDQILWEFRLQCENGIFKNVFKDVKMIILAYLVDIISLYVDREKGLLSGDVKNSMDIWMGLCKKLLV